MATSSRHGGAHAQPAPGVRAARSSPAAPSLWAALAGSALAVAVLVAVRRRALARSRVPVVVDPARPDGIHAAQAQLVFLEGGPLDGSELPLPWGARSHEVSLDDRTRHVYRDSGRTARAPDGSPARVFVVERS